MTKKMKSQFRYLTQKETDATVIEILDVLLKPIEYSGKHRRQQWEKGWGENLKTGDITPRYFGKHQINRLNGRLILPFRKNYEIDKLHDLVDSLAKKYMRYSQFIAEFGCGTGHNLKVISKINTGAIMFGFDWAKSSQKIVNELGFIGENVDFFEPPRWTLPEGIAVYTVAALEQTGTSYKKFVAYLLKNTPSIVVHIEPIPELLNPKSLLDYLSIKYMEKRKYLSGYLDYLKKLEKKGKIKIIEARRSGVGSMFIDGYSIVVWKPV